MASTSDRSKRPVGAAWPQGSATVADPIVASNPNKTAKTPLFIKCTLPSKAYDFLANPAELDQVIVTPRGERGAPA